MWISRVYIWNKSFIAFILERFGLTHLCQVDASTTTLWTGPFPTERVWLVYITATGYKNHVFNAQSDDPGRSAASDLGLHCLSMSL